MYLKDYGLNTKGLNEHYETIYPDESNIIACDADDREDFYQNSVRSNEMK